MHAKTDSEVTSLAPSSPTRSPRRQPYYVQSPSHDGGEKTATSFHSSPTASPHHSSSVGRHSRESSSSRFSGSFKPGGGGSRKGDEEEGKGQRKSNKCYAIEEEGLLLEVEEDRKSFPALCYLLVFVFGFFVLFLLFSLVLWGASRPQKPKVTMKSITFENFVIQAGSDFTGVATDMITMNSTVKFFYRNTGTFFGVHVTSTPLDLSYDQITIGSGSMKKFYLSRKSHRTVAISVIGHRIPLYGGGASLSSSNIGTKTTTTNSVPLELRFMVKSRADVFGQLIKPEFYKSIKCSVAFDKKMLNLPISLKNSCAYD